MWYDHRLVFGSSPEILAEISRLGIHRNDSNCGIIAFHVAEKDLPKLNGLEKKAFRDEITIHYEKSELMDAKWLSIRPAWQQHYIKSRDFRVVPCSDCAAYGEQVSDIIMESDIKKARRPFLYPLASNEILVSLEAKELLETSELKGFSFRPVKVRNDKTVLSTMEQLVIEELLPPAVRNDPSEYQDFLECPKCGTKHNVPKPTAELKLDRSIMEQQKNDIYKTSEYFGYIGFEHEIIISQNFYHFLAAHGLRNSVTVDRIVRLV